METLDDVYQGVMFSQSMFKAAAKEAGVGKKKRRLLWDVLFGKTLRGQLAAMLFDLGKQRHWDFRVSPPLVDPVEFVPEYVILARTAGVFPEPWRKLKTRVRAIEQPQEKLPVVSASDASILDQIRQDIVRELDAFEHVPLNMEEDIPDDA